MAWLALRSVRSSRPFLRVLTQRRFASNDQFQTIKPFSEIPGPKGLPILGSLLDVARTIKKAGDDNYFHQQLLKYGPIVKITTPGESREIKRGGYSIYFARRNKGASG
eukprot:Em0010g964a